MISITEPKQLVGLKVGAKTQKDTLSESSLQDIATQLGYDTAQVRLPSEMYDCQYDTSRLQVHVDEGGLITTVREG